MLQNSRSFCLQGFDGDVERKSETDHVFYLIPIPVSVKIALLPNIDSGSSRVLIQA